MSIIHASASHSILITVDTSLTHHDLAPYFLPSLPIVHPTDFITDVAASSWMHPLPAAADLIPSTLIEIPCNWYMEDMTLMQFLLHAPSSHGYISPAWIETMGKDRFGYLYSDTMVRKERIPNTQATSFSR